ncbi:S-acyl fatty acid synthase thioesterase, medium chain [Hirundo rustica]|uniref:S-acyl fatty acid synthase thioesterase, medium chain n=1 Tax=Hirundo rustica TaxID=43150 RepID=UPI001A94511E|nr:S-acyl fatty acid synthase thioesterase, medium chain [Hirundo rustica]XP_039913953.1 S-acyl fatty acid synthase thioesterase, medium chain [Hirundo rustica]XP_039913963.1 S-acyl fatty acid synthase thioesterase, medium chain [Hirundo rustica]XP_039913974.1 S-acyl fatty acid synthase thioesterase, medium chain [Hirundo rustica]XP_039913984.1 S-acyl fatty acid synthase thioesterase, medium chain [Hirundo rustica]
MEKLVACVQKKPGALCRLICFPWAGGGTSQLAQWGRLFNDSIEVFCIRLPGRESRFEEPFAKDMTSVVNEVTSVLLKEFKEKPFAFFAHSLGTYMSLAVALHLKEKYGLEPVHLFMSAAHAPNSVGHLALKNIALPDEDNEFLVCMEIVGGNYKLPHNEDIRKSTARTSREDARLFQTFSFEKAEMNSPFSCDITLFSGSDDKIYDIQGWQELTSGDTSFYEFPGDHFYLLKPPSESLLIKHITRCIEHAGV